MQGGPLDWGPPFFCSLASSGIGTEASASRIPSKDHLEIMPTMNTLLRKQMVAGLALTGTLFCLLNSFLDLGIFGGYGRQISTLSVVMLGIVAVLCAPTTEEEREIKRRWRKVSQ
jgi:hypothetical protein